MKMCVGYFLILVPAFNFFTVLSMEQKMGSILSLNTLNKLEQDPEKAIREFRRIQRRRGLSHYQRLDTLTSMAYIFDLKSDHRGEIEKTIRSLLSDHCVGEFIKSKNFQHKSAIESKIYRARQKGKEGDITALCKLTQDPEIKGTKYQPLVQEAIEKWENKHIFEPILSNSKGKESESQRASIRDHEEDEGLNLYLKDEIQQAVKKGNKRAIEDLSMQIEEGHSLYEQLERARKRLRRVRISPKSSRKEKEEKVDSKELS